MAGDWDIIFFKIPLCPKCKEVGRTLEAVKAERPEVTVKELNLITNLGLARKHGVMTAPALLVRGRPMTGVVSREALLEALASA
jgi:glutaredoxin